MSSGGAVELFVDISELGRVQQELSTLISALVELGSRNMVHADAASMGSHDVADAVNRFVTSWDSGRQHITENLQACQKYAAMAAQAYNHTETALQGALQPAAAADGNRAS